MGLAIVIRHIHSEHFHVVEEAFNDVDDAGFDLVLADGSCVALLPALVEAVIVTMLPACL